MAQKKGMSSGNRPRSGGSSPAGTRPGTSRSASTTWDENTPSRYGTSSLGEVDDQIWEVVGYTPRRMDAVSKSLRAGKETAEDTLQKVQMYLDDQFTRAKVYAKENPGAVMGALAGVLSGAGLLTAAIRKDKIRTRTVTKTKTVARTPTLSEAGRKLQRASAKSQDTAPSAKRSAKKAGKKRSSKKASSKKSATSSRSKSKSGGSRRKPSTKTRSSSASRKSAPSKASRKGASKKATKARSSRKASSGKKRSSGKKSRR